MGNALSVVLSCEHGGNGVPAELSPRFRSASARRALESHRGYDLGALELARSLARRLRVPLVASTTTRLVVDLNRAPTNPAVFSELTSTLPRAERERLLQRYHEPHRRAVEQTVRERLSQSERVVHLAVHSFTPIFSGEERRADVGLLYDPRRRFERQVVDRMQASLRATLSDWKILRNDPYRGTTDGLGRNLRSVFAASRYAAIEIEVNQRHLVGRRATRASRARLARALANAVEALRSPDRRSPTKTSAGAVRRRGTG